MSLSGAHRRIQGRNPALASRESQDPSRRPRQGRLIPPSPEHARSAVVLAADCRRSAGDRTVVVRHAGGVRPAMPASGRAGRITGAPRRLSGLVRRRGGEGDLAPQAPRPTSKRVTRPAHKCRHRGVHGPVTVRRTGVPIQGLRTGGGGRGPGRQCRGQDLAPLAAGATIAWLLPLLREIRHSQNLAPFWRRRRWIRLK